MQYISSPRDGAPASIKRRELNQPRRIAFDIVSGFVFPMVVGLTIYLPSYFAYLVSYIA